MAQTVISVYGGANLNPQTPEALRTTWLLNVQQIGSKISGTIAWWAWPLVMLSAAISQATIGEQQILAEGDGVYNGTPCHATVTYDAADGTEKVSLVATRRDGTALYQSGMLVAESGRTIWVQR